MATIHSNRTRLLNSASSAFQPLAPIADRVGTLLAEASHDLALLTRRTHEARLARIAAIVMGATNDYHAAIGDLADVYLWAPVDGVEGVARWR